MLESYLSVTSSPESIFVKAFEKLFAKLSFQLIKKGYGSEFLVLQISQDLLRHYLAGRALET